jgi:hypothetical protein
MIRSLVVYSGPSMYPTLRDPEILEVEPYGAGRPRAGDVVLFRSPEFDRAVVHRIVRVSPAGLSTRGDANAEEDAFTLRPGDIKGRVVAARRGSKRRHVAGGLRGLLAFRWIRLRRLLDRGAARLLLPLYSALCRSGLVARLQPEAFRPHVVVFRAGGRDRFRLLVGQHVVGQYDDRKLLWRIRRPFRLLLDERMPPGRMK